MTTVTQSMFIDFLCITQRFIGEIKITLHYITLHYTCLRNQWISGALDLIFAEPYLYSPLWAFVTCRRAKFCPFTSHLPITTLSPLFTLQSASSHQ